MAIYRLNEAEADLIYYLLSPHYCFCLNGNYGTWHSKRSNHKSNPHMLQSDNFIVETEIYYVAFHKWHGNFVLFLHSLVAQFFAHFADLPVVGNGMECSTWIHPMTMEMAHPCLPKSVNMTDHITSEADCNFSSVVFGSLPWLSFYVFLRFFSIVAPLQFCRKAKKMLESWLKLSQMVLY